MAYVKCPEPGCYMPTGHAPLQGRAHERLALVTRSDWIVAVALDVAVVAFGLFFLSGAWRGWVGV